MLVDWNQKKVFGKDSPGREVKALGCCVWSGIGASGGCEDQEDWSSLELKLGTVSAIVLSLTFVYRLNIHSGRRSCRPRSPKCQRLAFPRSSGPPSASSSPGRPTPVGIRDKVGKRTGHRVL